MLALTFALLLVGPCLGADIVDTLSSNPKASTLVQLVGKAGLVTALKSGTYTVFAPTDDAFAKVPQDILADLLTDTNKLADLLKYHVVGGNVQSKDIRNEELAATLAGNKIRLNVYTHNNLITADGAKISEADVSADNGVIHFVDDVLMPSSKSIVDVVAGDPDLSTLLSVVQAAGIANEFLAEPLTLFAPTNAAFSRLSKSDLDKLTGSPDRLKETLEYHGVPHTLFSKGVWNHEYPKSVDSHDDRLHIRVSNSGVTINNAKVTSADTTATNGVVHKIDHVLIPIRVGFWLRTNIGK